METAETISVAVIEDQPEIREGLRVLINGSPGFECVGTFGSMEAALQGIARRSPRIVCVDIDLPGMSGIDGIKILRQRYPEMLLVALTVYEDDDRIFGALCAGASGYLLKNTPPARLLDALQEAESGGSPMSPGVARRVVQLFRKFQPPKEASHELTPHEVRLLSLLADGHNYKTAAGKLNVSINTIAFHMKHIYEKLHVHSKSEAVSRALRSGIVR